MQSLILYNILIKYGEIAIIHITNSKLARPTYMFLLKKIMTYGMICRDDKMQLYEFKLSID